MNRRHALAGLSAIVGHALFPEVLTAFAQSATGSGWTGDGWPTKLVNDRQARVLFEAVEHQGLARNWPF